MDSNGQTTGRTVRTTSKFCQACGASVLPQDKFCEKCGNQLAATAATVTQAQQQRESGRQGTDISADDLVLFVGPNHTYYMQKWMTSFDPAKRSGWNWVAFFFTPMWFAYRKMYVHALIFFLVQSIASAVTYGTTGLVGAIIGGLLGNAYYYKHAKQKITQVTLGADHADTRKAKLAQEGGTSKGALFLVIAIWLLWSFFIGI